MPFTKNENTEMSASGKTYKSQIKASREYDRSKDIITIRGEKGTKARLQKHIATLGYESLNAYLCELIERELSAAGH